MNFGCDYYPEHWPEERWKKDAQMMAKAGFNVVRLAEFAWSKLEPEEGQYDFSWLDRGIKILAENRIRVILGTPTAAPPAWLARKHPTIFRVDEKGVRSSFGGRREYCPNSSIYRDYSKKIVLELARYYQNNENVIGWQIDNEFGGDAARGLCYCESCLKEFRKWLKEKYGRVEQLNKEWGTIFWSQTYKDWEEIPLPWHTETYHNPSFCLDYQRFISDSYLGYQQLQLDILRKISPRWFITHNFMGLFNQINYYDLAKGLDFVSWDNYPCYTNEFTSEKIALAHDHMRSLKKKNFWVMEAQSGPTGGQLIGTTLPPDEIRLWTYQAIAHGAEGILYFRWRTSLFGQEEYWHGILGHDGLPNRRYEEISATGKELLKIGSFLGGSETDSQIAILYSYDIDWAFQIQPHNEEFNYQEHLLKFYQPLWKAGLAVDIVTPENDLSKYRLVIAPNLLLVNKEIIDNLIQYVEKGGWVLTTFRSGVKNWNNVILEETLPGKLSQLTGIKIKEYCSLPSDEGNKVKIIEEEMGKGIFNCGVWCDIIQVEKAKTIGLYTQDYYQGEPALTINKYGKGYVLYLGTLMDNQFYQTLIDWLLKKIKITSSLKLPSGVELSERSKEGKKILFLLNHNKEEKQVKIDKEYEDLLTKKTHKEFINLKGKGVSCLVEK